MMGHKYVIIVDAHTSEAFSPGTIREFTPEQLGGQPDMTLPHALEFRAAAGPADTASIAASAALRQLPSRRFRETRSAKDR